MPTLIPVELGAADDAELLSTADDVVEADDLTAVVVRVVPLDVVELDAIGEATIVDVVDLELAALVEALDVAALDETDETLVDEMTDVDEALVVEVVAADELCWFDQECR